MGAVSARWGWVQNGGSGALMVGNLTWDGVLDKGWGSRQGLGFQTGVTVMVQVPD